MKTSFPSLPAALAVAALLPATGLAVDVSYYGVVKLQQYEQTLASPPAVIPSGGYAFNAFVIATTNFAVTNATVEPGNSTPARTLLLADNGGSLRFEERFDTSGALEAVYPTTMISPISYTVTMNTVNDGTTSGSITFYGLFGPLGYPTVPQVTNLATAQSIDTTRDFTLSWDWLGGNALQIVQFLVVDGASNIVFATPSPFEAGALTGASTSSVIPANTLPAGTNLVGHITVANPGLPNTSGYPGTTGIAALARDTSFPMVTRPAPVRPQLRVASPAAAPFILHYAGEPARRYHIQASADLQTWTDLVVTNTVTGAGYYYDLESPTLTRRFYRIQVGP